MLQTPPIQNPTTDFLAYLILGHTGQTQAPSAELNLISVQVLSREPQGRMGISAYPWEGGGAEPHRLLLLQTLLFGGLSKALERLGSIILIEVPTIWKQEDKRKGVPLIPTLYRFQYSQKKCLEVNIYQNSLSSGTISFSSLIHYSSMFH